MRLSKGQTVIHMCVINYREIPKYLFLRRRYDVVTVQDNQCKTRHCRFQTIIHAMWKLQVIFSNPNKKKHSKCLVIRPLRYFYRFFSTKINFCSLGDITIKKISIYRVIGKSVCYCSRKL